MNIGTNATIGRIASEHAVIATLADRSTNRQEKAERICDMISEAATYGESSVRLSNDFTEVVHVLWRMRGHVGQNAWRAMQEMIAAHDSETNGAAADAIIDRWERDWLRHVNNE
jgi:hypothetical protein